MADQQQAAELMELREKIEMNTGFARMLEGQSQRATIELRRTKLTLEELGTLPDDTVTYKPVGKT
jgi:chaperonin cofactor prefoldin